VPFWVSGGVRIEEIGAYLQLGVKVVGLTGSLFSAEALATKNMDIIRQNAARAAQAAAAGAPA
jgi:2-keto-3-deoxy-6-phosphogluconate aldolase